jgi:O-antigen ligase
MPAVDVIAALVALVWGTMLLLRGSLLGGCLAYLLATSCFGYEFAHFSIASVPLSVDRLVLLTLLAAYVVQRRLGRTQRTPPEPVDLLLMVFLGVVAASTLWGAVPADLKSLGFRLVAGYAIPLAIYWIARQIPLDRGRISLVHGVLAGLGIYLGISGVLEITGQWWAVFPRHIADPNVGLHFGRARGPMVHAVSFGLYLGVGLLAAWIWQWRFGRLGRLLLLLPAPLMLAGLYGSYTRSVWLGAALGLMLVLGLSLRGMWRPLVLGGMVSAALLLAITKLDSVVSLQRELPASYAGKSVELRGEMAYISAKMFLDHPLLGVGFDQFFKGKLPYLADRSTSLVLEATRDQVHHNTFLSLLTETGLVGLGLVLAILILWGRAAWRLARDADLPDWARAQGVLTVGALGVYVCQALFHELSYLPMDNTLMFFLAGITMGLQSQKTVIQKIISETF